MRPPRVPLQATHRPPQLELAAPVPRINLFVQQLLDGVRAQADARLLDPLGVHERSHAEQERDYAQRNDRGARVARKLAQDAHDDKDGERPQETAQCGRECGGREPARMATHGAMLARA